VTPPPTTGQVTVYRQAGTQAGSFVERPRGIILHGSRSGQSWSIDREFDSCRNYAAGGANGLGWNATVGEMEYSIHLSARNWGWNARSASRSFLGVELAQARYGDPITDAMVIALVHWYQHEVLPMWGELPLGSDAALPSHNSLPEGAADGKSDCYLDPSPELTNLRKRIRALL
jgi:hypothetical protein